jgi:hypothetical protein
LNSLQILLQFDSLQSSNGYCLPDSSCGLLFRIHPKTSSKSHYFQFMQLPRFLFKTFMRSNFLQEIELSSIDPIRVHLQPDPYSTSPHPESPDLYLNIS